MSWRKLDGLLARLPSDSHYRAAAMRDEELAEVLAAADGKSAPARVPLTELSTPVLLLMDANRRLEVLSHLLVGLAGKDAGQLTDYPLERTAAQLVDVRRSRRRHDELVAEVHAAQERWARQHESEGVQA